MEDISLEIKPIIVSQHFEVISKLMEGLHEHERELFDKTARWKDIEASYMRHVTAMQEECEGTFLIAYLQDKPVGFIFGYVEEQDDSRIEEYTGKELYVSDGYVMPEYRRKGIYQKLNEKLEQLYIDKGVKRITRFTLVDNSRMKQFLETKGYKVTRLLYEKWL